MTFRLSERSLDKLEGVNPILVAVVNRAIELTTFETQRKYVTAGKSQTMTSKHLTGDAVDLVAYVEGSVSWELNLYDDIADAMKAAATELGVEIKWGAAWNVPNICAWEGTMNHAMCHYIDERRAQGRKPFIDGPHFELA